MKKVFHFDAPREKYHCDAAIVGCFDHRFGPGFRKFLKRSGILHSDHIQVAGGAKCLASPERDSDREFVLEQIRKSMRLHGTRRVILMLHSDCGAYGGLAEAFAGDARAEREHHQQELRGAASAVAATLSGVETHNRPAIEVHKLVVCPAANTSLNCQPPVSADLSAVCGSDRSWVQAKCQGVTFLD